MYMGGKKFLNDQEVKSVVNSYLTKLDKLFYRTGIEKLVQWYDKCLNLYGDYVEKRDQCAEQNILISTRYHFLFVIYVVEKLTYWTTFVLTLL